MVSRRNALLAGIGLAGIAAYARNLFALGAHVGAEKFEVSKTEAVHVVMLPTPTGLGWQLTLSKVDRVVTPRPYVPELGR